MLKVRVAISTHAGITYNVQWINMSSSFSVMSPALVESGVVILLSLYKHLSALMSASRQGLTKRTCSEVNYKLLDKNYL